MSEFETNHAAPVQAIIRPSQGYPEATVRTGKLAVNLDARVVSIDDQPVHLTGKEYAILELLTLRKGTIATREMLLNHLYGGTDEPELKIIDVFVCKLRSLRRRAAITLSKRYGAAAIFFTSRWQRRPPRYTCRCERLGLATARIDDHQAWFL